MVIADGGQRRGRDQRCALLAGYLEGISHDQGRSGGQKLPVVLVEMTSAVCHHPFPLGKTGK